MDRVPAQVALDVIETGGLELVVQFLVKRRFGDVECVLMTESDLLEVHAPVEIWGERLQLSQVNLVIKVVRLAPFHACERSLGQRCLHRHDPGRLALCRVGLVA